MFLAKIWVDFSKFLWIRSELIKGFLKKKKKTGSVDFAPIHTTAKPITQTTFVTTFWAQRTSK